MDLIRDRKVNLRRKLKPESVTELETSIGNIREAIERGEDIVRGLKGNPSWEALKKTYQERLNDVEAELSGYNTLTERGVFSLLQSRVELKTFIDSVETVEARLLDLKEELSNQMVYLEGKKERLGNGNS